MFEGINTLIKYCWIHNWSGLIYNGVVVLAFFLQMLDLMFYRKNYQLTKKQAGLIVLLFYPTSYLWMLIVTWAEIGFQKFGSNNIVRLYVWMPLLLLAVARIMKLDKKTVMDFIAPSCALQQAIAHTVCPFAGCCNGYEVDWGVWNPLLEKRTFPCQWLECLVAFFVFLFLRRYAKKTGYNSNGKVFPLFLITFGGTRFFLEFLRDNEKVFAHVSELAMHALMMVVVGAIWLLVMKRKEQKKNAAYIHMV